MNAPCARCGEPAVHKHHRKMRSQGGLDDPANLAALCLGCHTHIHANPKESYEQGWLVKSWDTVRPLVDLVGYQQTVTGEEVRHEDVVGHKGIQSLAVVGNEIIDMHSHEIVGHEGPQPGTKCPTCQRRVNHPKKASSPQSKVVSYRVPLDDADTHDEIAEAAAKELGLHENPHWRWALNTQCYAMVLQGSRLTEKGS